MFLANTRPLVGLLFSGDRSLASEQDHFLLWMSRQLIDSLIRKSAVMFRLSTKTEGMRTIFLLVLSVEFCNIFSRVRLLPRPPEAWKEAGEAKARDDGGS